MTPERWRQIEGLYHEALARDASERGAFLASACEGDELLQREVESLLAQPVSADGPLDGAAAAMVSEIAAPLATGTRIGVYAVQGLLGTGGMGEVYRAIDTDLKRQVALKVLPAPVASDSERVARFQREAEVLASLNHPNIAAVYGLERANGAAALVMELVDGPTLADRVARGPLPLDQALAIAVQVADALEAAHERGIVHRDLKPANIKVRPDGAVKLLDFGLAKPLQEATAIASPASSPTFTAAATSPGIILGTAAYMSPEQARGRIVDSRSDIFSFGSVLYEMLTGVRAFGGDDVTEVLGRVVTAEPDWNRLPARTHPAILRLLRRALNKDPQQRLSDIRDARLEIEEARTPSQDAEHLTARPRQRWLWMASGASAVAVILGMAIPTFRHLTEVLPRQPEIRLDISTPSTLAPLEFALSPDGKYLVFVGNAAGARRLLLRSLNDVESYPLAGTDGAAYPFWSADSRSIAFFTSGSLYRIDIPTGSPQFLANAPAGRGGSWNLDGTILFAPSTNSPLLRTSAAGGEPTAVTELKSPKQSGHRYPQFLPDGRHFLFYVQGSADAAGIYLGSFDGAEPTRLTPANSAGAFREPNWLFFVQQTALVARKLDLSRRELTGDPIVLTDAVVDNSLNLAGFSVTTAGPIAYRGNEATRQQLTWLDRTGKVLGVIGEPQSNNLGFPELSPDGKQVVGSRILQNNVDVFLGDLVRGDLRRFTFDNASDDYPHWSPDGKSIAFGSTRNGARDLYLRSASGAGADQVLMTTPHNKVPQDWSRDGRFLLYHTVDPETGLDLLAFEINGNALKPIPIANSPFDERFGQFSPDSRWIAYATNESRRFEIVVQHFPEPSGKWQVSTGGGVQPRWRNDGKELYFIAPDGTLMGVPITPSDTFFAAGSAVALFPSRVPGGGTPNFFKHQYAVSSDGRFLLNRLIEESATSPITVIVNWDPESRRVGFDR